MIVSRHRHGGAAWAWLVADWNWPAAGLVAAGMLGAVLPAFWILGGLAVVLVAAQLPAYLVHQAEEHLGDRFRASVNAMAGCEALSKPATFWINVLGVWAVDLVSLVLMVSVGPAWGLLAAYLTLVNAAVHIVVAAKQRRPNPGLVTAVVLFLPLGSAAVVAVSRCPGVTLAMHFLAVGFVVLVHAAIVGWVLFRRGSIAAAGPAAPGHPQSDAGTA